MIRRSREKGFTLLEIVLVVSLSAVISYGIYKTFLSGINLWDWLKDYKRNGEVALLFDRIEHDLQNGFNLQTIDFKGSSTSISFYEHNTDILVIPADDLKDSAYTKDDAFRRIEYIYSSDKDEIKRKVFRYGSTLEYSSRVLLTDVKSARFKFYLPDPVKGEFISFDVWEGKIPGIIELKVSVLDESDKMKVSEKIFEASSGL